MIGAFHWTVLFAAIPVSLIVVLVWNSVWYKGKNNMYIVGMLVLTLILLVYFLMLQLKYNLWQLFILLPPAEFIVLVAFHIRKRAHKHTHSEQEVPEKK